MTYKHGEYQLYKLKTKHTTLYFFSKKKPKSGTKCDKPSNRVVGINKRTGLPYLKKKK